MAQPNDAGIGGGQLSAEERARREALRKSLLANAAKYAPKTPAAPRPSATSSTAYDPLSSANTGKPAAARTTPRTVGATVAPSPEEIMRQRPAPVPAAPARPLIPTVAPRPSATSSTAYDPLSSANTGRPVYRPPEPPPAPQRREIPARGYNYTDGSYTGATPQQRAQEVDWAMLAAQATARENALRREREMQPAPFKVQAEQMPVYDTDPYPGWWTPPPDFSQPATAERWTGQPAEQAGLPQEPLFSPPVVQYVEDRYQTRTQPGGDAWVNYSGLAAAERKRAEEAERFAAMGLPTTYMPYSEEELRAMESRADWYNPVFAEASRFFDYALYGPEKEVAIQPVPGTARTDDQGNPIPDTELTVGAGFGLMVDALWRAGQVAAAGNLMAQQSQYAPNMAIVRSAEQQMDELVAAAQTELPASAEALRDVNVRIAQANLPAGPVQGPPEKSQVEPPPTLYDWYAEAKRNYGIPPVGPLTLNQTIRVAERDPNYFSAVTIDGVNKAITDINRQVEQDARAARYLANVRPMTYGEWQTEAPTFYDALEQLGVVNGQGVPYPEMATLIASSGAEAQTRVLENFEMKAKLPEIRELRNRMLWSGTENGMALAMSLNSLILRLEATPYSDLVDLETNIPMELLENVLLDPLNLLDIPFGKIASFHLAGKVADATTALRTVDNADDLAALSKLFRDAYKPWLEGGRVGDLVFPANAPADLIKLLPTANDLRGPGSWFGRQLARTPETQVHLAANNLWMAMSNVLYGVDNVDDAIRILRTASEAPQEMIKGLSGLTSPTFRAVADEDGLVRWGPGVLTNKTFLRETPIFQAGAAKVIERMEKAQQAAMEAAKKAGTFYDGSKQRVNPLELLVNLNIEWERAARQLYGIAPIDPPANATKVAMRDLANGTAQVEWLDDADTVIRQLPPLPTAQARTQLNTLQAAMTEAKENPLYKAARVSAEVQRHIMSDMWLNLRPAHWVRNATAFTLALNVDGLYSFKSVPEMFGELGKKAIGGQMTHRLAEGSSGAGTLGELTVQHWTRKYNPLAWMAEHGAKVWTGYGQILGAVPFGEQAGYLTGYNSAFNRLFGGDWTTLTKQELNPLFASWGVDPDLARAMIDKIVEVGRTGSKADVAQAARQMIHGAGQPFSVRNLGVADGVIPVDNNVRIVEAVNSLGRSVNGTAPRSAEQVQQEIRRVTELIRAEFDQMRHRPGAVLAEALPQPSTVAPLATEATDTMARLVDDALADAQNAGITDPHLLAVIEEEAQQYARRLVEGETLGWESVLDEMANAPDNPAGMVAAFDLLSQVYELKRMARQEVDELMAPVRAARTRDELNAAWAAKFAGTSEIYAKLADDLQAVFAASTDTLRRIAAGEEVPQQRDWWDVITRYLDFDARANLQDRGVEFGDMMQEDPAIVQKVIDANRAYVDSSYIQLYDVFRRYPSLDALDVLRMAQQQIDVEGARAAAFLRTQRKRIKHFDQAANTMVGDLTKEEYYVIRNDTWRGVFDNQVIFNQAAARAIAAHALAMASPTQLTWTDDFFGGTFQLIGPAVADPINNAIALTIDDIFESGAFDAATGKIADGYLAPRPLARQGKNANRWAITPVETETQMQALAVVGVTEKRGGDWYLLIRDPDAAAQAVAERGRFAWLARNVETGEIAVFGSPNPQAPIPGGQASNARVPGAVMQDFDALVRGDDFPPAPDAGAAPTPPPPDAGPTPPAAPEAPTGPGSLPPDGSGGGYPAQPFTDTGRPGRSANVPTVPQEVLDAKAVQSDPAAFEQAVDEEIGKVTPLEPRPEDDVIPEGMGQQEWFDAQASVDARMQAAEAEADIAQPLVIDFDALEAMPGGEWQRAPLPAGGSGAGYPAQPFTETGRPGQMQPATPAPVTLPPVTAGTLNQLAAGAGIATSKADGAPTHRHLINAINKDAKNNGAGWSIPQGVRFNDWVRDNPQQAQQAAEWLAVRVENAAKLQPAAPKPAKPKKGKAAAAQPAAEPEPWQVTKAEFYDPKRVTVYNKPERPRAGMRGNIGSGALTTSWPTKEKRVGIDQTGTVFDPWDAVDQRRKFPTPAEAVEYYLQLHEQYVRRALAEGKTVPAEVLADYPHLAAPQVMQPAPPLPPAIQKRMGSEGNAYMEARRQLPPGGSGGAYPAQPVTDTGRPGRPYTPPEATPEAPAPAPQPPAGEAEIPDTITVNGEIVDLTPLKQENWLRKEGDQFAVWSPFDGGQWQSYTSLNEAQYRASQHRQIMMLDRARPIGVDASGAPMQRGQSVYAFVEGNPDPSTVYWIYDPKEERGQVGVVWGASFGRKTPSDLISTTAVSSKSFAPPPGLNFVDPTLTPPPAPRPSPLAPSATVAPENVVTPAEMAQPPAAPSPSTGIAPDFIAIDQKGYSIVPDPFPRGGFNIVNFYTGQNVADGKGFIRSFKTHDAAKAAIDKLPPAPRPQTVAATQATISQQQAQQLLELMPSTGPSWVAGEANLHYRQSAIEVLTGIKPVKSKARTRDLVDALVKALDIDDSTMAPITVDELVMERLNAIAKGAPAPSPIPAAQRVNFLSGQPLDRRTRAQDLLDAKPTRKAPQTRREMVEDAYRQGMQAEQRQDGLWYIGDRNVTTTEAEYLNYLHDSAGAYTPGVAPAPVEMAQPAPAAAPPRGDTPPAGAMTPEAPAEASAGQGMAAGAPLYFTPQETWQWRGNGWNLDDYARAKTLEAVGVPDDVVDVLRSVGSSGDDLGGERKYANANDIVFRNRWTAPDYSRPGKSVLTPAGKEALDRADAAIAELRKTPYPNVAARQDDARRAADAAAAAPTEPAAAAPTAAPPAAPTEAPPAPWHNATADDIRQEDAANAFYWTSQDPDGRGRRWREGYVNHMDNLAAELAPYADTPEKQAILRAELERYRARYLEFSKKLLAQESRTASAMVTGPANFNAARNRKAIEAQHNTYEEMREWSQKAQTAIERKLRPEIAPITGTGENALARLQAKLAELEAQQQRMVDANKIVRGKGDNAAKTAQLKALGLDDAEIESRLVKGNVFGNFGYASFELTNNGAEIRRIKERIAGIEKLGDTRGATTEWAFDGGRVVDNVEEDRVQVIFDAKLSDEDYEKMRKAGFVWSRKNQAFQRGRMNARYSVLERTGVDINKPPAQAAATVTEAPPARAVPLPAMEDEAPVLAGVEEAAGQAPIAPYVNEPDFVNITPTPGTIAPAWQMTEAESYAYANRIYQEAEDYAKARATGATATSAELRNLESQVQLEAGKLNKLRGRVDLRQMPDGKMIEDLRKQEAKVKQLRATLETKTAEWRTAYQENKRLLFEYLRANYPDVVVQTEKGEDAFKVAGHGSDWTRTVREAYQRGEPVPPQVVADYERTAEESAKAGYRPPALQRAQPIPNSDPRLLRQQHNAMARGAAQFLDDGTAILRGLESPDVSTAVHEMAHVFRRDLATVAGLDAQAAEDMRILHNWVKLEPGQAWTREAEEQFARGFETYLQSGKAPTPELQSAFARFKAWLAEIYRALRGEAGPQITPEMRGVYDRLLADAPAPAPGALDVAGAAPTAAPRTPNVGPNTTGKPRLVGVEWKTMEGEKWSSYEDGLVAARVSDWDKAEISAGSGREIVHVYYIQEPDGTVRPYGKQTAADRLGYSRQRIDREAQKYLNQIEEAKQRREWITKEVAGIQGEDSTGAAYKNARERNRVRSDDHALRILRESRMFERDGKYHAILAAPGGEYEQIMLAAGWKEIDPPAFVQDLRRQWQAAADEFYQQLKQDLDAGRIDPQKAKTNIAIAEEEARYSETGEALRAKAAGWKRALDEYTGQPAPTPTAAPAPAPLPPAQRGVVGSTVKGWSDPARQYDFQYEIVKLDDLIASNLDDGRINPRYPAELQPRDRTQQASQLQVAKMAGTLSPDELLTPTNAIDRGAPIVGPDNVIESGNGRVLAMRKAPYETYGKYTDALINRIRGKGKGFGLESWGITPEAFDAWDAATGRTRYVLIRRRVSDVDRVKFAQEANARVTLGMNQVEAGKTLANNLAAGDLLTLYPAPTGKLDDAFLLRENQDAVRRILQKIPRNEQAAYLDASGQLNPEGSKAIRSALFSIVFPDNQSIVRNYVDTLDTEMRNIGNGIERAIIDLAKVQLQNPDMGIGGEIAAAIDIVAQARKERVSVARWFDTPSFFEKPVALRPLAQAIDENIRSGKVIGRIFTNYTAEAIKHVPGQASLLGGDLAPDKIGMLNAAIDKLAEADDGQLTLYGGFGADRARILRYVLSDEGQLTLYGGFGAIDPRPAMQEIYQTMIRYWRKPRQPVMGDVALHQVTSLNDAEDRILAALPALAQPRRNNFTAAQANALIDAVDKRLLPAFDDAVSRASYGAQKVADTAMLNYRDRRGIDSTLALMLPYHYFYTRGGATWLRRIARKPSVAAMYYDIQKAIETENKQAHVPNRFKGTIPLWNYPGGQIRMANPLNTMIPFYMYMPDPFQNEEGDTDVERMWTALKNFAPGVMPVYDVAMAAVLDQIDPLPDGESRVARYTNLRNYIPLAGTAADAAMAQGGIVTPTNLGGDPFDTYRIKRTAGVMAQQGAFSDEMARYVIQLSVNLEGGGDPWANIPADQTAAVRAAYIATVNQTGRDKLLMGSGAGYLLGANLYNFPYAERELQSAQDLWRYAGYGEQNPAGSAAQRSMVMEQNPALGAYMARSATPGSPYQPGQQAQANALYDRLDPLYAQQGAIEDQMIAQSGYGVSGDALRAATAPIQGEIDAARAQYPNLPAATGKPRSGSNPAELAEWMLRQAVPQGGPVYPGKDAPKAELQAYYDARDAWEKEKLATFQRNLTTVMAGNDPAQDEINFELYRLTAGKDTATLLREYGSGYYDSPTRREYDARNAERQAATTAKFDAAESLILQEFGQAGLDVYKGYANTEQAGREAYKKAHPELKALNLAAYNPEQYRQAVELFGKEAILAWAKMPPSDGSEAASAARAAYNDANPGAYLMNAWMNGRPTPFGETIGPWAALPSQWGMEYQYNFGKDFNEAATRFGADIWQIVAGYKRGWTSKEKATYFDKYPQLGDFFDWWNALLPDDGQSSSSKSSGRSSSRGYSSYKRYYRRSGYRRRSYGGYSRSYGGGGGGWGGGGWNDEEKAPWIDDVDPRWFDRSLWNTQSELRRWEPPRPTDSGIERWRPARYGYGGQ